MILPLKDKITSSALHKLIQVITHSTNMTWTSLMCQTLCWALKLQGREGHSIYFRVHRLVGRKITYNKTPHMILGYEDEIGHLISLGWCVQWTSVTFACWSSFSRLVTTSNISFGAVTPPPLWVHMVKVGAIPSLRVPVTQAWSIKAHVNDWGLCTWPKWGQ